MDKRKQPHTEEHKKKIASSLMGHTFSTETLLKMHKPHKSYKREPISQETKEKIRQTLLNANLKGDKAVAWKGGKSFYGNRLFINKGKKLNYRVVVEDILGRPLKSREVIHHINENPSDDRPENLFLFRHSAAHTRWHAFLRRNYSEDKVLRSNLETYKIN